MKKYFYIIIIVLLVIKIYLISVQQVIVNAGSIYDDMLIVEQASSILKGEWLGEYNYLTLVKGPFTPLFIAFANILHIPFLLAQEIFYDIAIIFLINVLSKKIENKWILIIIYITLLFNPITFSTALTKVYRNGIYTSLIIFLIAIGMVLFYERRKNIKHICIYQIFLGIIISCVCLCREENVWLIPYLLISVLFNIGYIIKDQKLDDKIKRIATYFIPVGIYIFSMLIIMTINYKYYGVFQLNQYWGKEFKEAYGSLLRIIPDTEIKKVPITMEMLNKGYDISPKFAELKDFFDGNGGKRWLTSGDEDSDGTQIQGGWIHWALMEAADYKGYYKDAKTANKFYEDVANEINSACDNGEIESYPYKIISNSPIIKSKDIKESLIKSIETIKYQNEYREVQTNVKVLIQSFMMTKADKLYEEVTREKIDKYANTEESVRNKILTFITQIYKKLNPILFYISLISTIIYIILNLKNKEPKEGMWILIGLWVLYYSRIFILTYTSLTMYSMAINVGNMAPAYSIQLLASLLAIIYMINSIKNMIKNNKVYATDKNKN